MFNRQYEAMSVRSPDISGGETCLALIKGELSISYKLLFNTPE